MNYPPPNHGFIPQTQYTSNGNNSNSMRLPNNNRNGNTPTCISPLPPNFNTSSNNQSQSQASNNSQYLNHYQTQSQSQHQHQQQQQAVNTHRQNYNHSQIQNQDLNHRLSYNHQDYYYHQIKKSDSLSPPDYYQSGPSPEPIFHHSRSHSAGFGINSSGGGGGCNGSHNKLMEPAHEDIPRTYLIAPPLETPFKNGLFEPFRIIVPCEAPVATYGNGRKDTFHITAHDGYTVKNPREFIHKHQVAVDRLCTITCFLNMGATVAGAHYGVGGIPNNLVEPYVKKTQNNLKNRTHVNRVGLDVADYYSIQEAIDNHQRDPMRILLKAAALNEKAGTNTGDLKGIVIKGQTYWVCDECYEIMNSGQQPNRNEHTSFREYIGLTRGDTLVDVTLRNYASVRIITQSLKNNKNVETALLKIVPDYFEAPERSQGSRYRSIQNQFQELCGVLKSKKNLYRLEIFGNSSNTGETFERFRDALLCPALHELRLQGLPNYLSLPTTEFRLICDKLKTIILDGIQLSTENSILNFHRLIENNKKLHILMIKRASLTRQSIDKLVKNKEKSDFAKRMANLELLDLSHNDLGTEDTIKILTMVTKKDCLKTLVLVGNPRIGDQGCGEILDLLISRKCHCYIQIDGISLIKMSMVEIFNKKK